MAEEEIGTEMTADERLEAAEARANEYLAVVDWTGEYDPDAVLEALKEAMEAVYSDPNDGIVFRVVRSADEVPDAALEAAEEYIPRALDDEGLTGADRAARETELRAHAESVLRQAHSCIWDVYWMAFYDSAYRGAQVPSDEPFAHIDWLKAVERGLWAIVNLGGIIIGVARPMAKTEDGVLHCATGPAIVWGEEESFWWRGTQVPKEWITDPDSVDPSTALTHENIEQRRALCEILGWNKILEQLEPRVIDEDPDPEIGTLLEVDLPDAGPQRFLRVRCGTGREFCILVENSNTTARQANAASYGLTVEEFNPEFRT